MGRNYRSGSCSCANGRRRRVPTSQHRGLVRRASCCDRLVCRQQRMGRHHRRKLELDIGGIKLQTHVTDENFVKATKNKYLKGYVAYIFYISSFTVCDGVMCCFWYRYIYAKLVCTFGKTMWISSKLSYYPQCPAFQDLLKLVLCIILLNWSCQRPCEFHFNYGVQMGTQHLWLFFESSFPHVIRSFARVWFAGKINNLAQ